MNSKKRVDIQTHFMCLSYYFFVTSIYNLCVTNGDCLTQAVLKVTKGVVLNWRWRCVIKWRHVIWGFICSESAWVRLCVRVGMRQWPTWKLSKRVNNLLLEKPKETVKMNRSERSVRMREQKKRICWQKRQRWGLNLCLPDWINVFVSNPAHIFWDLLFRDISAKKD